VRVFVDSNIFIASAISDGQVRRLLDRVLATHTVLVSEEVLAETSRILLRKFKQEKDLVQRYQLEIRAMTTVLPRQGQVPRVSRDTQDDWIFAAALEGDCHCILSGDEDVTSVQSHRGIRTLRPRDFLAFEDQIHRSKRARRKAR